MYRKQTYWAVVALWSVALLIVGCSEDVGGAPSGDVGADSDVGIGEYDAFDSSDSHDSQSDTSVGGGPLQLEPGEAVEVTLADGLGALALATAGDEAFLLILVSTRLDGDDARYEYEISINDQDVDDLDVLSLTDCSLTDAEWRDLVPEVELVPAGVPPAVDDEREFIVPLSFSSERIDARVIAVGDGAVVWGDISEEHPAELDAEFVDDFLSDFDVIILPRLRAVFGVESDIDDNGRVDLLFTPLTYQTAVAFFSPCDLTPDDCSIANEAELLYLTPPNSIDPPYNTPNAIKEILAHELQHLIHFNRSVLRNERDESSDNAYVHEGLGALAQDVSGYQAGNLYVTKAGLDEIDSFSLGDILVDYGRYDRDRDGPLRGGAYLFVRWLYDRGGGDEAISDGLIESRGGPMLIRALIQAQESTASLLPEVTGSSIEELAMDFFTAVGASNRDFVGDAAPVNPCFSYLPTTSDPVTDRQRGTNLFAEFHGQAMNGPATQLAASPDGYLSAGGVEYLILEAEDGGPHVSFSVDVNPDAQARLRIVRVR